MKKAITGAVALLCIVFLLASCDNPAMQTNETINPFVGTWVHETGETWVFSHATVAVTTASGSPGIAGTYIFDDRDLIITANEATVVGWGMHKIIYRYIIEGNTLFLDGIPLTRKETD